MGFGAKSWLPNICGNAQIFSPYMRRSLVIYDFALDPSEFPNIWDEEHLIFFFISVITCRIFALMKQCDKINNFQYRWNLLVNEMVRTEAKRKERIREKKGRFTFWQCQLSWKGGGGAISSFPKKAWILTFSYSIFALLQWTICLRCENEYLLFKLWKHPKMCCW